MSYCQLFWSIANVKNTSDNILHKDNPEGVSLLQVQLYLQSLLTITVHNVHNVQCS
jgi:hypothetical protein